MILLKMQISMLVLHVLWLGLVLFSWTARSWMPKDDLQVYSSWSSHPLVLLGDIHANLFSANYDCTDRIPSQSQPGAVGRGARGGRS